jgi:hypothetical protein
MHIYIYIYIGESSLDDRSAQVFPYNIFTYYSICRVGCKFAGNNEKKQLRVFHSICKGRNSITITLCEVRITRMIKSRSIRWAGSVARVGEKMSAHTGVYNIFSLYKFIQGTCTSEVKLYYDQRSVGQSILVSGTLFGPATNFSPSFLIYSRQLLI